MYKIRKIATQLSGSPCMGLSVPAHISVFFEDTFFRVSRSSNSITFTSGTKDGISNKQVEDYKFDDVRV